MTLSEQVLFCSLRREESVFPIPVTSCFTPCGEQVSANSFCKGPESKEFGFLGHMQLLNCMVMMQKQWETVRKLVD